VAGDEVIVTKAGKHTHGLDRFFDLFQSPVNNFIEPSGGDRMAMTS
jgi:hypothetical protein